MNLEENVQKCLNNGMRAYNMNYGPYTLIIKHENQIQIGMKNRINIHVKKLLIEEKDDKGIFAMKGLSFLCNFIHIYLESLKHVTMESLCS